MTKAYKMVLLGAFVVLFASTALAGPTASSGGYVVDYATGIEGLSRMSMGAATVPGMPDYDWWYGCTPTSTGMVLGKYDRDGYGGMSYDNLAPGGQAETRLSRNGAHPNPNPALSRTNAPLATSMIASTGHVADFYIAGAGASGDDVAPPFHAFDCLADFMGTSQDSEGSANGSTWVWNWTNGSRLHYSQIPGLGITDESGMYGIYEFVSYAGYGSDVVDMYNQYTDNVGAADGFTFADFMAEIDAGRSVVVHVEGHSMLGYGYYLDAASGAPMINIDDTWGLGVQTMPWGGSYSGMGMRSVTVIELAGGGIIPEPATIVLFSLGIAGFGIIRRKRRAA